MGSLVIVVSGLSRGDFRLGQIAFVALSVGLGAALGAQIGARLCDRVNAAMLRLLFVVVSVVAGLSILL